MANRRLRDLLTKGVESRYSLMQAGLYYLYKLHAAALLYVVNGQIHAYVLGPSWPTSRYLACLDLSEFSTQQPTSLKMMPRKIVSRVEDVGGGVNAEVITHNAPTSHEVEFSPLSAIVSSLSSSLLVISRFTLGL